MKSKKSITKLSVIVVAMSIFYVSCKSDNDMHYKNKEHDEEEMEAPNTVGIQNVNGNIPDTTNTVDISTPGIRDTLNVQGMDRRKNAEMKKNVSAARYAR